MQLGLKILVAIIVIFIAALVLMSLFMVWTGQANDMASAFFGMFKKISPFNF